MLLAQDAVGLRHEPPRLGQEMRESDRGNHEHSDEHHLATHPSDPRSALHAITVTVPRRFAERNPSLPGLPGCGKPGPARVPVE
jgi:hypothetical protein